MYYVQNYMYVCLYVCMYVCAYIHVCMHISESEVVCRILFLRMSNASDNTKATMKKQQ